MSRQINRNKDSSVLLQEVFDATQTETDLNTRINEEIQSDQFKFTFSASTTPVSTGALAFTPLYATCYWHDQLDPGRACSLGYVINNGTIVQRTVGWSEDFGAGTTDWGTGHDDDSIGGNTVVQASSSTFVQPMKVTAFAKSGITIDPVGFNATGTLYLLVFGTKIL